MCLSEFSAAIFYYEQYLGHIRTLLMCIRSVLWCTRSVCSYCCVNGMFMFPLFKYKIVNQKWSRYNHAGVSQFGSPFCPFYCFSYIIIAGADDFLRGGQVLQIWAESLALHALTLTCVAL